MKSKILFLLLTCCQDYTFGEDEPINYHFNEVVDLQDQVIEERFFYQIPTNKLDVLFVIDKSCSMTELEGPEFYMNEFVDIFFETLKENEIDFHVGVTPASAYGNLVQIRVEQYINNFTENPEDIFRAMNAMSSTIDGNINDEAGSDAMYLNMNNPENFDFFRNDANQHLIVISDEEDSSEISSDDFLAFARNWRGNYAGLDYTAIVRLETSECSSNVFPVVGYNYMKIADGLLGKILDVCGEWSQIMEDLGNYNPRKDSQMYLKYQPVVDSLSILVEYQNVVIEILDNEWEYDEVTNSILFYEPIDNSTFVISYEVDGVK